MEVKLYVYDLTRGMARMMSRQMVGIQIDAVYHTAIVLDGIEYFFGAGIQTCRAGTTHHGQPMEVVNLGKTDLPKDVILEYLQSLKEIYTPESYDLFTHNCNNFSHDFAMFLVGRGIPDHITNLPQRVLDTPFGQMLRPQLDASMRSVTQAPVLGEEPIPDRPVATNEPSLPLLKLGSAKAVTYSKMPPLDKLSAKLGAAAKESAFASLIRFDRTREHSPSDAALPDMQVICATYQSLSAHLPAENEFAAVDLLRYAASDPRMSGYLAEESKHTTIKSLASRITQLGDDCPHNLRLVTIQLLCNCFSSHLFFKAVFESDDDLLQSILAIITSSLLDEAHTTSRVSAAWLAFNVVDGAYRSGLEEKRQILSEEVQVELAASMLERLQRESSDEAVKALLLTLGRLLRVAPHDGEVFDLMSALDAQTILRCCSAEQSLAREIRIEKDDHVEDMQHKFSRDPLAEQGLFEAILVTLPASSCMRPSHLLCHLLACPEAYGMSTDSSRKPSAWSYVTGKPRRRSSVALPHREIGDRFEKRDRHTTSGFVPITNASSMQDRIRAAWMNQSQRTRWLKTAGLLFAVFFLFYYFTSSGSKEGVRLPDVGSTFRGGDVASDSSVATTKCKQSYSKEKPLIQYALMIDAGSTGSRIHVYRFNNCGPTPELENEVFEMTPKRKEGSGLSAYKGDPEAAAKSLDVLMKVALDSVPEKLQGCTPIAVKATAGLRKIGPEASEAILAAVRSHLDNDYPFPLVSQENGGVQVMDGKDEGVYAWITTNYLLGKIGGPDKTPTAAIFDLGGGSTQIVFQPTFPDAPNGGMPEVMVEGDHKYSLKFGGRSFELYQHSYLGYGLMEARNNLHRTLLESIYTETESTAFVDRPVVNPCLAPGMSRAVEVTMLAGHPIGDVVAVNMTGPAVGATPQCRFLAEKTLKKESTCKIAPCAFNGVHQPSLEKTFAREDIYLFSFFFDRLQPLGMPESFTLRELKDLTAKVCEGGESWNAFTGIEGALHELQDRPESCLDLNFMLALLHTGYEMPIDREVKIAKKIKGNELGWCLGASLPLLNQESGWKCKISPAS